MKNKEIAARFDATADILEILDANRFRINAYRRAARVIDDLTVDVAGLLESGELTGLPGIGQGTAESIEEYLETGTMQAYESVRKEVPKKLVELLEIPGLGPKTIGMFWRELDIRSLRMLRRALGSARALELPGMGAKRIEKIRAGIRAYESRSGRTLLGAALPIAESIVERLREVRGVKDVSLAGSARRFRATIGDLDILVASGRPEEVIGAFTALDEVEEVLASGTTKASVRLTDALQVDLRVVAPTEWGAALMYFTGSKEHNVRLRGIARQKDMKLSEYGLFSGEARLASRTEKAVYHKLGMPWIPPELREDRGEVEAALEGDLPELVTGDDIRGDLHHHSDWSDGLATLEEVASSAKRRGYEYIIISDHSRSLRIANGLSEERLLEQGEEIDRINRKLRGLRLLKGTEADIRSDGTVDFADEILESLDVVIASIHSGFEQSRDRITGRITDAMRNPHVDIIGHPTGRLLERREPYAVDLEAVMRAAAETGTALEINCHDERVDLDDIHARRAAEMGVRLSLGTDSHDPSQQWMMDIGVHTARRAWLSPDSLLNTMTARSLLRYLASTKKP